MAILAGSGTNADVTEESAMQPIIEAGILKTRIRPRRTAGRTRLVWRGLPDRAAGRRGRCACRGWCLVFGPGRSAPAILCGVSGGWPAWYWLTLPGRLG
jgi:hypothetical protein